MASHPRLLTSLVRPIERSSAQQYLRSGPVPFANCGGGGPCVGEELGLCNRERNEIDVPLPDVLGQVLGRRSCPEEIDLPAVHRQKIGNHPRTEPVRVPFHRRHRGPHAQPRLWIHPLTQRVHHVYRDRSRQVLLGHVYRALVPQFTQPDLRRRQDFEIYVSAFDSSTQRRFYHCVRKAGLAGDLGLAVLFPGFRENGFSIHPGSPYGNYRTLCGL